MLGVILLSNHSVSLKNNSSQSSLPHWSLSILWYGTHSGLSWWAAVSTSRPKTSDSSRAQRRPRRRFHANLYDELGVGLTIPQAYLFGAYTHKYPINALGIAGVTNHYVVLAYNLGIFGLLFDIETQHLQVQWLTESEANYPNSEVHINVLPYFKSA